MKHIPRPILVIIFLAAAISLGPLVFPYGLLQNKLETCLGTLLNAKVTLAETRFNYAPAPTFTLEKVIIDSADAASIGSIEIPVTLRNVLYFGKELRDVQIRNATFSRPFALSLPGKLQPRPDTLRLGRVILESVHLKNGPDTLGPFAGTLDFKSDGQVENLTIRSPDNKIDLQIQPAESGAFAVLFSAKNWKLPFAWPVEFEYLNLTGKANQDALQITDISGGLYNGVVTGNAQLLWNGRWQLNGQIQGKHIRAEPLLAVFSPTTRFTGTLNGNGNFRYEADGYATLFDNPALQGSFSTQEGTLRNIDLITPLKSASEDIARHGGQTVFNSMNGKIVVQGKAVSLRGIHLESGKFRADGELSIRDGRVSGGAATALSAGVMTVSNRISLSGTLADPVLRSDGAWRPSQSSDPPVQ